MQAGQTPLTPSILPQAAVEADLEVLEIQSPLSAARWRMAALAGGGVEVFVLIAGNGTVHYGDSEGAVAAPCALWLPRRVDGMVDLAAGARGARLRVSGSALARAAPVSDTGQRGPLTVERPLLGARLEPAEARRLVADLMDIGQELAADRPGAREVCQARLQLVLIAIWRLARREPAEPAAAPEGIVEAFLHLLELHWRQHLRVADYAQRLGVSTDRLVSALVRATGLSPKALIQQRLLEEARLLLERSPLQVMEIAAALGFKDAGYFNRFFVRHAGIAPGRYRTGLARRRAAEPDSYAAWP